MDQILRHWPIITVAFLGAAAWGGQQVQLQSVKETQQAQTEIIKKQAVIQQEQARIDERTRAIQKSLERNEKMLELLLERTQ